MAKDKRRTNRNKPKDIGSGDWFITDNEGYRSKRKKSSHKKYITTPFDTKQIAKMARDDLLKYFDKDNEWTKRLRVQQIKIEDS